MPPPLPAARWALTPPFHPCPRPRAGGRSHLCGAFPRVAPGGRYPPPSLPGVRTFLDAPAAAVRPSARASLGRSARRQRRAPQRARDHRDVRRRRPAASAAGRKRSRTAASTASQSPPAPHSPTRAAAARNAAQPPPLPRLNRQPDRPSAERQPPPVEFRTRIGLAPRRHVRMRDHPACGMSHRASCASTSPPTPASAAPETAEKPRAARRWPARSRSSAS